MSLRTIQLFALLTSMGWGLTGIFIKLLPPMTPFMVTNGRLIIAILAITPFILFVKTLQTSLLNAIKRPIAWILALLMVAYYLLATAAFQIIPVAKVALLLSTPPLYILLFRCVIGNKPNIHEIIGAFIAIIGMVIILLPKITYHLMSESQQLFGELAALTAAALTAIYALIFKYFAEKNKAPEPIGVSILTLIVGCLLLSQVTQSLLEAPDVDIFDLRTMLLFIGLGVASTAIPTLGFAIASKALPPILTACVSLFIPIFAGVFSYFILAEQLSTGFIAGSILVIGGVTVIIRGS